MIEKFIAGDCFNKVRKFPPLLEQVEGLLRLNSELIEEVSILQTCFVKSIAGDPLGYHQSRINTLLTKIEILSEIIKSYQKKISS